ncbi:hypothetical protein EBZ80_23400 [bacterium]|nr:hypothetical protein [bacterium]
MSTALGDHSDGWGIEMETSVLAEKTHVFNCVHCGAPFVIKEHDFNCRILRHGVMRADGRPINPHAPRAECERLVREGLIWGCGKPMRIVAGVGAGGGGWQVEECDYI